jgi:hypothetical protein
MIKDGKEMSREHTDLLILTPCTQSLAIVLLAKEFSWMVGIRVPRTEGLVPPLLAGTPHPILWNE